MGRLDKLTGTFRLTREVVRKINAMPECCLVTYLIIDISHLCSRRLFDFESLPDVSFAIDNKQWVVLTKDLVVN